MNNLKLIKEAFEVIEGWMPDCESSDCYDLNKETWSNFKKEILKLSDNNDNTILNEIDILEDSGITFWRIKEKGNNNKPWSRDIKDLLQTLKKKKQDT